MNRPREVASSAIERRSTPRFAPVRVGSVAYLNAAPLTFTVSDEVLMATPSELARKLRGDELDAALVSVAEVLNHDRYDVLDGLGIISRGPVKSVILAHRPCLSDVDEVFCDPASLTSVGLLQVLLGERGLRPRFVPLVNYADSATRDAVLLIGDEALDFQARGTGHRIWDLGQAWRELRGLPFVYAVWALRRGVTTPEWRARLRESCQEGIEQIEAFIRTLPFEARDAARDYFATNIVYELGEEEKAGLREFSRLLRAHTDARPVEVKYVT